VRLSREGGESVIYTIGNNPLTRICSLCSQVVADKLPDIYQSGTTLNIWLERENAQQQAAQQAQQQPEDAAPQ